MDKLTGEVVPIVVLCAVIALVVQRLPKVDLGHSPEFLRRRVLNWLPLGLTYAFLYMGRYNVNGLVDGNVISNGDFGNIDAVGQIVYGLAFLLNGPLADRLGGRFTILVAAAGAAACNAAIGIMIVLGTHAPTFVLKMPFLTVPIGAHDPMPFWPLMLLNAANMYFQSFGAVSIVKVNASWFHLRERGTFGGIFGILISIGIYLALDWAPKIASLTSLEWMFLTPALILVVFWLLSFLFVRDTPKDAGFADFDVADASSGDTGPAESAGTIIKKMLSNRIILTIAFISLCSGFLRMGILKWQRVFAKGVHADGAWASQHWGMVACIAGITGGMFAGIISDHVFNSRRPPVAIVLFGVALVGSVAILPLLGFPPAVTWAIAIMLTAILGVHGMLSGVASQDFGGRRNAGTATGLIDGFVYFGGAAQAAVYARVLPTGVDAADPDNWRVWPLAMIPMALIGIGLSLSIRNARVQPKAPH